MNTSLTLNIQGEIQKGLPAVLCIPGNSCSPEVFDGITVPHGVQKLYVSYLTSKGPWDVRSLGARVAALKKELDLPKVILAGYSAGGVISMAAAARYPEEIDGLMLSNTGPCSIGHGDPHFAQKLRDNYDNEEYMRTFIRSCFVVPPSSELDEKMWLYTRTTTAEAACQVSQSIREEDFRNELRAYHNPVMIAHGELDTRRKLDSVERMKDCMPQSEVVLLKTGHTPMAEDPSGYQACLDALITKVFH